MDVQSGASTNMSLLQLCYCCIFFGDTSALISETAPKPQNAEEYSKSQNEPFRLRDATRKEGVGLNSELRTKQLRRWSPRGPEYGRTHNAATRPRTRSGIERLEDQGTSEPLQEGRKQHFGGPIDGSASHEGCGRSIATRI